MTINEILDTMENGPIGNEEALPLPSFVHHSNLDEAPAPVANDDDVLPLPRWEPAAVRGVRGKAIRQNAATVGETALEIPRFVTAAELED